MTALALAAVGFAQALVLLILGLIFTSQREIQRDVKRQGERLAALVERVAGHDSFITALKAREAIGG